MTVPNDCREQACQILELLPPLGRWATERVQRVGEAFDLSLRQYAVLRAIRDGVTSPGELARRWQVTGAVITGLVDRLERRGLVRREADPADRRRQRLALTDDGRQAAATVERALVDELAGELARSSADDRACLDRALTLLARALSADAHGDPTSRDEPRCWRTSQRRVSMENDPMATDATAAPVPAGTASHTEPTEAATEFVALDMRDANFMANAYDRYAALRETGRVVPVRVDRGGQTQDGPFGRSETWFVTHYDDVVATLLDDRLSSDVFAQLAPERRAQTPATPEELRPLARSLIVTDPPDHTRLRKLVQPSFTGRNMAAMRPAIQETIDRLLDAAERAAADRGETAPNRQMELIGALAYPFPVTVISDLLGIPADDRARIKGWTEHLLRADRGQGQVIDETVRTGLREFAAYLRQLFARLRREPGEGMIAQLVRAEDEDGALSEEELLSTVFLMYLAGHVTTVNLVGNAVVALLTHPDELAKLQADPTAAKNAVEETLRYWGPVDFVGRRFAMEDMEIAGTDIPRGDQVSVGLAAANRDPGKFANPDAFDISRPDATRHIAFGKGIHVCLGAPLARVEGQIALETLVRRYPDLRLAAPIAELTWGRSFLRGFGRLPLLF
ncbi:MAG: cytochrome P450 [Thermomicrobiales bacterium]|nr:cytochrome P450 [Thermomicrobiales bacterium]